MVGEGRLDMVAGVDRLAVVVEDKADRSGKWDTLGEGIGSRVSLLYKSRLLCSLEELGMSLEKNKFGGRNSPCPNR